MRDGRQHMILLESVSFLPWCLKRRFLCACQHCMFRLACVRAGSLGLAFLKHPVLGLVSGDVAVWHCSGTVISVPKHRFENFDATIGEGRLSLGTIPLSLLFQSPFKDTDVGFLKQ